MTARELMTENPVTISPRATVAEAWDLMREMEVRHLPVIEAGAVVGIVSDRDLGNFDVVRLLTEEGAEALGRRLTQPIAEVMNTEVVAADPELEMSDVIALLLEHRVGAVPVIARGRRGLVGIISYLDVLRAVAAALEGE